MPTDKKSKQRPSKNRLRLIQLMRIIKDAFENNKDLSMEDMLYELEFAGVSADRRSLYRDLRVISDITDYKIQRSHNKYRVVKDIGMGEQDIKIITNALLSARFLSKENTRKLIERFHSLTGYRNEKGKFVRVNIEDSVKTENDITKNIEVIDKAIKENRKICFKYLKYSVDRRKEAKVYDCIVSPYAYSWYEDYYYMLGNYTDDKISYYRIDRMKSIKIIDEPCRNITDIVGRNGMLNVPEVIGKLVGMSSGKEDTVRIRFGKDQIGRVRDKFGSNLRIVKTDKNDVEVLIKVINNKELKPWILKFSDSAEVLEPADLREDIKLTVERIRQKYSY